MVAAATMIVAAVTLTLLVVTALKKHVHTDAVVKNVLDEVPVTVVQDPANVQMGIPALLVNAPPAQMTAVAKVLAIRRQVCAVVLVDTLATIAVHVYVQRAMIH
jgi:hypothetical protein